MDDKTRATLINLDLPADLIGMNVKLGHSVFTVIGLDPSKKSDPVIIRDRTGTLLRLSPGSTRHFLAVMRHSTAS